MGKGSGNAETRASITLTPGALADTRNVINALKGKPDDEIRAYLNPRRHPFRVLVENYAFDFNLSTSVRNHNAFLGGEFGWSGRRKWDTRGAVGCHHYEPMHHYDTSAVAIEAQRARGGAVVVVDALHGSIPLDEYPLQEDTLLVFGQEDIGVHPDTIAAADAVVYPSASTPTASLNIGTLSGIAMYEYLRQQQMGLPLSRAASDQRWQNLAYPEGMEDIPFHDRKHLISHRNFWDQEAPQAAQAPTRPVPLLLDQISYDFNIATATRNQLVFGSEAVLVGSDDPPTLTGQHRVTHAPDSAATIEAHRARGYQIIAFDLVEGSTPLWEHQFDQQSLLVFGQERDGLGKELLERSDQIVHIPQFGSTRSLNVGTSTGIALYEYARQQKLTTVQS